MGRLEAVIAVKRTLEDFEFPVEAYVLASSSAFSSWLLCDPITPQPIRELWVKFMLLNGSYNSVHLHNCIFFFFFFAKVCSMKYSSYHQYN